MLVNNVDGEHEVPDDDPGICPHGKYVGGCGWDLMCHWCEMGEEPYVPNAEDHFRSWMRALDIPMRLSSGEGAPGGLQRVLVEEGTRTPEDIQEKVKKYARKLADTCREEYVQNSKRHMANYAIAQERSQR